MSPRTVRLSSIAVVTAITMSCKHYEPLVEQDFEITALPVVLHFAEPYQVTGPTRELCVTVVGDSDLQRIAPDGPATRNSPLLAVMIRASGERDTIGYSDQQPSAIHSGRSTSPSIWVRDDTVCLWDHGLGNPDDNKNVRFVYDSAGRVVGSSPPEHPLPPLTVTYGGVELRSSVPFHVRVVSFWAGQRKKFL